MRPNDGWGVRLALAGALVVLSGLAASARAQAATPRLVLKHTRSGALIGSANWVVSKPVTVRVGYDGNSPNRPFATLGKNYAGAVFEDSHGRSAGGSVFFAGSHDRLGDPMPADLDTSDGSPLHLHAGRYRIVFFADAPSTLSFALEGAGARGLTITTWKPTPDYKTSWVPLGPLGNGNVAIQQDLPVQLRKATYGQFFIYSNGVGANAQNDTACLIPHSQAGSCSPFGNNEFGGAAEGDCATGGTCFGYLAGRFWTNPPVSFLPRRTPGLYDIEFTHETIGPVTTSGAFTLIKN
jgi:hypothetical protein